jgi:hypothetical protein
MCRRLSLGVTGYRPHLSECGIFRQPRLIAYMVEIRVRYVTNADRIVNIVPLLPLWPMTAAGE